MQLIGVLKVGGSNLVRRIWRRRRQSADQDSNRRPKTLRRLHYHLTGGGVIAICPPTTWSLLSENF